MEPVRSERLKSIFLRAAEANGAEREAVLREECGSDGELRRRVEELLGHHDETGSMDILPRRKGAEYAPTLVAGRLVSKRFRVRRFVGKGGMGEVYEASDEELGGVLALKIILPGLIEEEQMLARFRREVHLARQVTHPNVCRIFDVGRDKVGGVDLLYLTMELIDGETLTEYLKREGKLRPADALPLLTQMAAGLKALHEKNIVHRDLKPSNVMLVRQTGGALRAVIGDFGLARAVIEESLEEGLSRSGMVMGTPGYMAPEQLAGMRVSAATDVYAFGVLAYEMVTGKRAFPGRHGMTPPPGLRTVAPELPADWDRVIMRCLEQDPAMRPASAEAAVEALSGQTKLPAVVAPRRKWWIGGVAALVLSGLVPLAWQRMGGPRVPAGANAAYLEATDLLDHAYRNGALEKAIALLEPMSKAENATALTHAALARGYYRKFRVTQDLAWMEKAQAEGTRAVEQDGSLAAGHLALGRLYTQSGKLDLAAQELENALRIEPRNADIHQSMAELREKQGRLSEVEPSLLKAVDLAPDSWAARATLGMFYLSKGRYNEARREFEELRRLVPDNPAAYNYLGILNLRTMRLAEARAAFEKELELAPSFSVYSNLALVAMQEGRYDDAIPQIEKAIAMNPKDYRVWGNLALSQRWSVRSNDKAMESYRKAIALAEEVRKASPKDGEMLARLAGFYAVTGDKQNSLPLLRQAIALDVESSRLALRVAETYEILQQRDEALRWIGIALKRGQSLDAIKINPELAQLRKDPRFPSTK